MALKSTPFLAHHQAAGGRLIDFGGWNLPVQYTGVLDEHHTVRTGVGLFDVSHMGEVEVKGPQALAFAQHLVTNDVSVCELGHAQYSAMCYPDGGIVDDLITYRRGQDHYLFCINAANIDKDVAWMTDVARNFDVELVDRSAHYAQLALQGQKAQALLSHLTQLDLGAIAYYRFAEGDVAGVPTIVARTGYTGEDGFELFFAPEHADTMWKALFHHGEAYGLRPIGLGARDTLRLEMKYALYGNDIDATTSPLEAGLGWVVKLNKADFIGKAALVAQKEAGIRRKLVGFELTERNVPRHGYDALNEQGEVIGQVTSGAMSPSLSRPIGMVYLPVERANVGDRFAVSIRQKAVGAVVVKTPFYKPTRS